MVTLASSAGKNLEIARVIMYNPLQSANLVGFKSFSILLYMLTETLKLC